MPRRFDFTRTTKRLVAERAAYRCSFPTCARSTIGPAVDRKQSKNTGVAAHIYSAAIGGPRGQGGLDESALRSADNAIWLCTGHAQLVDTNRGVEFPPSKLRSFKAFHESRIAREQGGIVAPYCWFQEMIVSESPVFTAQQRFQFGKVTVISGLNGSGKSAICEWLSCLCGLDAAERWANTRATPLDISLSYFAPDEHTARLRQCVPGQFLFFHNGMPVPFYPVPIAIVHLPQSLRQYDKPQDEIECLSELLSVNHYLLGNLITAVKEKNAGEFDSLEVTDESGVRLVLTFDENLQEMVSFTALSHSMRARLLLELCVARARVSSRITPTILLLENLQSLDGSNLRRYTEYLSSHEFQTIITLIRTPTVNHSVLFESVVLEGTCENVTINQKIPN